MNRTNQVSPVVIADHINRTHAVDESMGKSGADVGDSLDRFQRIPAPKPNKLPIYGTAQGSTSKISGPNAEVQTIPERQTPRWRSGEPAEPEGMICSRGGSIKRVSSTLPPRCSRSRENSVTFCKSVHPLRVRMTLRSVI